VGDLIRRMAKRIYDTTQGLWTGVPWAQAEQTQFLRQAREALQEVRRPTPAMTHAAAVKEYRLRKRGNGLDGKHHAKIFRAMIDAELADG
jgi:hypothetical protein